MKQVESEIKRKNGNFYVKHCDDQTIDAFFFWMKKWVNIYNTYEYVERDLREVCLATCFPAPDWIIIKKPISQSVHLRMEDCPVECRVKCLKISQYRLYDD